MRIILLRHGQYKKNPETLTKLGIRQAQLAANRLKEYEIGRVFSSTMPRAVQTAHLVRAKIGKAIYQESDFLRECVPGFSAEERDAFGDFDDLQLELHKVQADKAYESFITGRKKKKNSLLVCHGNIIRYLVCKSLNIDTNLWTYMDIYQCGLTILRERKGRLELESLNDIGHIPSKYRTYL
ncbi:MAG: histidine phosphatase family protein [Oligoflexia bacterium]|nr:histidine phosphatase family protein [Oligoflexia bacterium]